MEKVLSIQTGFRRQNSVFCLGFVAITATELYIRYSNGLQGPHAWLPE